MNIERANQLIIERITYVEQEWEIHKELYPKYVKENDRESVGEIEGRLRGLSEERDFLNRIKDLVSV